MEFMLDNIVIAYCQCTFEQSYIILVYKSVRPLKPVADILSAQSTSQNLLLFGMWRMSECTEQLTNNLRIRIIYSHVMYTLI